MATTHRESHSWPSQNHNESVEKNNDDKWSVNYNTIVGYLIESVKELKKENDAYKTTITKLHEDMSRVKEALKIRY